MTTAYKMRFVTVIIISRPVPAGELLHELESLGSVGRAQPSLGITRLGKPKTRAMTSGRASPSSISDVRSWFGLVNQEAPLIESF